MHNKLKHPRFTTAIDAISDLQARGFFLDFTIVGCRLFCAQEQRFVDADDVEVLEMYMFKPGSRRAHKMTVCAIESTLYGFKGVFLFSGSFADEGIKQMLFDSIDLR